MKTTNDEIQQEPTRPAARGFARMSPERRREVAKMGRKKSTGGFEHWDHVQHLKAASRGGYASSVRGTSHRWTSKEAKLAVRRRKEPPVHKPLDLSANDLLKEDRRG
jgi:general stress protein YciG